MKNCKNKIIILIFVFLIILLLSIPILIANTRASNRNNEIYREKIYYEIKYLEAQIVEMIDLLNNTSSNNNFYIDWQELQIETRNIYNYWNSTILDFNNLEIDKKDLTDFGKDLDNLIISTNNNIKEDTIKNLLSMYNKLIIYSTSLNSGNYNNILNTKIQLLRASSTVETGNWTLTHEYILQASTNITNLVNSFGNNEYNQYNINKAYIAIKELENLINIKDLEVFYFKYKNAMENIEKIKIGEV